MSAIPFHALAIAPMRSMGLVVSAAKSSPMDFVLISLSLFTNSATLLASAGLVVSSASAIPESWDCRLLCRYPANLDERAPLVTLELD